MRVAVLGSGSSGNAVVVTSGEHRLLIDAGFSCRQLEGRLRCVGEDPAQLEALLLTHEHTDHVRGAMRLARRHSVPISATSGTLRAASLVADRLAFEERPPLPESHVVRSGRPFEVPGFQVEAFAVPHDAAEPVGYVVEDEGGRRLGLAADLGCRSQLAWGRLRDLDCLILETNHDLGMLRSGPYPWHLKQRVAGRHGHLSNEEAAAGLPELLGERLRTVVLYHLSRTNNLPALAVETLGEQLDRERATLDLMVSDQHQSTAWIEL